MRDNKKSSWAPIILALLLLWPVGLYLLFHRYRYDKRLLLNTNPVFIVVGVILICMGIFGLVHDLNSDQSDFGGTIAGVALCWIGGVSLIIQAGRMRHRAKRYKRYIRAISQNINSVNALAKTCSVSPEKCREDIEAMLDKGFFPNAFYNAQSDHLELPDPSRPHPQMFKKPHQQRNVRQPTVPTTVQCRNCGAVNALVDTGTSCEYCGGHISL